MTTDYDGDVIKCDKCNQIHPPWLSECPKIERWDHSFREQLAAKDTEIERLKAELAEARGRLGLAQFSSSHRETREWDCWSCRDKEPDERHGWTLERWIAEAAKKD